MVSGYKDKDGRFHPIQQYKKVSRKSRVRYSNDTGSSVMLGEAVKDFAKKSKERYNQYKAKQLEEFNKDIELRRKFEGRLIRAYRLGRAQKITNPREMEKFMRQQIPDLPRDKSINKFVVNVIKDFKKREEGLEKSKRGKSEEEKEALQKEFERSLEESEKIFEGIQLKQQKKFDDATAKKEAEYRKKMERIEKENKEMREAIKEKEKKIEEARKIEQSSTATEEEKKKAQEEVKEAKEEATKETKEAKDFTQDVMDELRMEEEKISQPEYTFGFPKEIVTGI